MTLMNDVSRLTPQQINELDYVSFMGLLNETNRPPGGKDSMRRMAQNAFLTPDSHVIHSGCNTGYCSFELSHISKCRVTAVDLNPHMIDSAKQRLAKEPSEYRGRIDFSVADAHQLPFPDETFDLVMSGGSTAFMKDKSKVVREYRRVCKPYGFVGDVFLYYHASPPQELVDRINVLLNISIQVWDREYWLRLYTDEDLEFYYLHDSPMPFKPSDTDVETYCEQMVGAMPFAENARAAAFRKLLLYMKLFNENHKYLSYCVFLSRNAPEKEQITLFGN